MPLLQAQIFLLVLQAGGERMKDKTFRLNSILTIVLGIILFVGILVRVFAPIVMLPNLDIPNMVLISLIVLLADNYLSTEHSRDYVWILFLAILTFGLLPWVSGFASGSAVVKIALVGGGVFTAVTWMFSSVQERIQSGKSTKATLLICAVGIYFAAQCFAGMIL